jgi:hypothetical protein
MGQVLRLSDYVFPWKKIFCDDSGATTLEIHMNTGTCELEILSYNDEGECIRKVLTTVESVNLHRVLGDSFKTVIS